MPKIISLIIILLISQNLLSQNKKEQIQILTDRVDSLFKALNFKNIELIKEQEKIYQIQQKLNENYVVQLNFENQILRLNKKIDSIMMQLDSSKKELETSLNNNIALTRQIQETKKVNLKYDFASVIGNSLERYAYRISGNMSGCIGESCEEIPSDTELYNAIQNLNKDYNNDGIINLDDLVKATTEIGDVNEDGNKDIYDINYPSKIKYTKPINNPEMIKDDGSTTYYITGKISENGRKIIFNQPINISYPNTGEGDENINSKDIRKEIHISTNSEIIVYRNKIAVIKGKILSGITQAYIDGYIFEVEEVVGIVK